MNIMTLINTLPRVESNKLNRVLYEHSNQQNENNLQSGGSNLGPHAKLASDIMLNDRLS